MYSAAKEAEITVYLADDRPSAVFLNTSVWTESFWSDYNRNAQATPNNQPGAIYCVYIIFVFTAFVGSETHPSINVG